MQRPFTFRKDEILRKKKLIEKLFAEGNSFFIHPFKAVYLVTSLENPVPAQVLIIAGKKTFRLAVDRNRARRQTREAYRLNKHLLYEYLENQNTQVILAVIRTSNKHLPSQDIDIKIKAVIRRLIKELENNMNNHPLSLSEQ